ncbi:ABC transporter substrate-binding protein [Labrenzia sp. PHM005]|uniref:substrate-binding periplasmic protein n=1 Tax=Labrenzia sp. PHM005 TaxID=2590016 RepID=UPI00143CFED1|nr:transporter substrate-binding domain-containing protein [Labrenzia sp. PHM005]
MKIGFEDEVPFHFQNSDGAVVGRDAEHLRQLLESVNCRANFVLMPWSRTLIGLKTGQIDMAMGASFVSKRTEYLWYSRPYKTLDHYLFVSKHDNRAKTADEFVEAGLRLGIVIGWHYTAKFRDMIEALPREQLETVETQDQLIQMLERGRIDGFLSNGFSFASSEKLTFTLQDVRSIEIDRTPLHYVMSKNNWSEDTMLPIRQKQKFLDLYE